MSSHPYYGGDKVSPAIIYPLKATCFRELVSLFHVPHPFKFTRQEYHSWPTDKQKAAKDGPYVVACTFAEGTTRRNDAAAIGVLMVCMDIDDPELARQFVEAPEVLSDALYPYNFLCYHTASSTPEKPRLRILVDIEFSPVEMHKRFVLHCANLIGMPREWAGRRESNVLSQPMYRSAVFLGEEVPPVITSRTNGEAMTALDIPEDVEEEIKAKYAYRGACNDDLDNLPIPNLTPADIKEALFKLDPDMPYDAWVRVACGLRHNFRTEEEAEEAFHLFDTWSRQGSKYQDGDTLVKWMSFKPDFGSQRPVTIKTLLEMAIKEGWKPTRIVSKFKVGFHEWLEGCDDSDVLAEEGPRRIAELPFKSPLIEEQLVQALRKKLKGNLSLVSVKSAVAKARGAAKAEERKGNKPAWILPWCYVRTLHKFYNSITGVILTPEAFNLTFSKELKPVNPEDDAQRNGKPVILPVDFVLTVHEHEQVDRIAYDPRKGSASDPYFTAYGQRFVNEYRFSTVPAEDEKNARKAEKAIRRHLKNLFPNNPEAVEALIDWMAFLVQYPGVKIRWIPVIIGAQGCGKTFLASFVGAAIGEPNVGEANSNTIKQGWNDWAVGYQLVKIEELWVSGKGRAEIYNAMKDILTNDFVVVNRRNRDAYKVEHTTNYAAFSNHFDPIPLEESDRRWWVLQSAMRTEQQVLDLTNSTIAGMPYFDYMGQLLLTGARAIRAWLRGHQIRPSFNPNGHAPKTEARSLLIESAKNPLQLAIEQMVESGDHPMIGRDLVLYEDIANRTVALSRNNHPPAHYLHKLGFQPVGINARHQVNGSRSQVWVHAENYDADMFGDPVAEMKRRYEEMKEDSI